jgi:hypothetical protein
LRRVRRRYDIPNAGAESLAEHDLQTRIENVIA